MITLRRHERLLASLVVAFLLPSTMGILEAIHDFFAFSTRPVTILTLLIYSAIFASTIWIQEVSSPAPEPGPLQLGLDLDVAYRDLQAVCFQTRAWVSQLIFRVGRSRRIPIRTTPITTTMFGHTSFAGSSKLPHNALGSKSRMIWPAMPLILELLDRTGGLP